MSPIYERVIGLINEKGISQAQFCRDIGVSKNIVQNWKTADPSLDNLKATATYFDVATDYLLGLTDKKNQFAATKHLSKKMLDLIQYFENSDFTDKQCDTIQLMVANLQEFNKSKQVDAPQQEKVQ